MGPSFTSFADILFAGLSGRPPCDDAMTALTTEPVGDGAEEDGMYGGDGRGGVGNGYLRRGGGGNAIRIWTARSNQTRVTYSKTPSSFLKGVPTRGMFSELDDGLV